MPALRDHPLRSPAGASSASCGAGLRPRPTAEATTGHHDAGRPPPTAGPRLVNGVPQVTAARPGAGRPPGAGSRARLHRPHVAGRRRPLWLAGGACYFFAPATHSVTVSPAGRLSGEFTVPAAGACRMSDGERPVTAGHYAIAFACTALRHRRVDGDDVASRCADVAFAANSDNLASDIVAVGHGLRRGRGTGAQASARRWGRSASRSGWMSTASSASARGRATAVLPSADCACTSGRKKVTFHRT